MNADTRQTLIGVFGLSAVEVVALTEGFNGPVTVAYFISIVALVAPEALKDLNLGPFGGGR